MRSYIHGSKKRLAAAVGAALLAGAFSIVPRAEAHPILDAAGAGVTITGTTDMSVTSTATNNLIKWVDFSIGSGEKVAFGAQNYLNYVTGSARSDILGTLTGGGHIYIVNPNGILIGDGATVNVGNLHLSTKDLTGNLPTSYADGISKLAAASIGGDVINLGTLNATSISVEGNNITFKNAADVTKGGTIGNDGKITGGTAHNDSAVSLTADGGEIHIGSANASTPGYTMTATAATATDSKTYMYKLINDAAGLQAINNNRSGNYMLAGNIDMSSLGSFTPLGTYDNNQHGFTGHFDGLNYEIQNFSFELSKDRNGLFDVNNGVIENLGLTGGSVTATKGAVGGIVALNGEDGIVRNVYNTSNVTGTNGNSFISWIVGGIVGVNRGTVERAYNTGAVQCNSSEKGVGGIVGSNEQDGTIRQVFNAGNVSGKKQVGGIVGVQQWTQGYSIGTSISDAYNTGTISGMNDIGGIVGHVHGDNYGGKCSITNVYNTGAVTATGGNPGKIAGNPGSGTLTNTYTSADDLKKAATFTGFDFSSNGVWRIYEGETTPLLTAFLTRKDYYEEVEYNGTATGDVGLHNAASRHYETGIAQTGAKAFNYIKDYTEVTPKALTVSFGAVAKEYDGTTAATAGTAALGGKVGNDDVSLDTANLAAVYDDENAGVNKTVTYSGIALTGGKAKNYRLTADTYVGTGAISRRALWLVADPVTITEGQATPTVWNGSVTGFVAGDGLGANDVYFFAPDNPAAAAAGKYSVMGTLNGATNGEYGLNYTFANAAGNATAFTIKSYTPPTPEPKPTPTPEPKPKPTPTPDPKPRDNIGKIMYNPSAAKEYTDIVAWLNSGKAGNLPLESTERTLDLTYTDINMPKSMSVEALAAMLNGETTATLPNNAGGETVNATSAGAEAQPTGTQGAPQEGDEEEA